jgi:hypothetical protein
MSFSEFLLIENTTTQLLKTQFRQDTVKFVIAKVSEKLNRMQWTRTIAPEKKDWLIKWITYQWFSTLKSEYGVGQGSGSPQLSLDVDFDISRWNYTFDRVVNDLLAAVGNCSDYLATVFVDTPNVIRSKLNTPTYTPQMLAADSEHWHVHIASQKRKPAGEGRVVPLQGMPSGWQWVSLDKASCSEEGAAMGHCGNAGGRDTDNIYSLRDSRGIAHLTFIVNNGVLGESKGYGNSKPTVSYHKMIIPLLLGQDNGQPIVEYIKGGGYKPENNFHFQDLSKEDQQRVLKVKPYITNFIESLKQRAKGDPQLVKKELEETFSTNFEKVDFSNGFIKVKKWDDMHEMIEWLKENTQSKLKEVPDFDAMLDDWHFSTSVSDAIEVFKYSANKENHRYFDEMIELLKVKLGEDDDEEDYDVRWAVENNDEIEKALTWAADEGYRVGAESDAYNSVIKSLDHDTDENVGCMLYQMSGGSWEMRLPLQSLEKTYREYGDSGEDLISNVEFTYSSPYNGYSGFDDDIYNERLSELLSDAKDAIE